MIFLVPCGRELAAFGRAAELNLVRGAISYRDALLGIELEEA
jgi:hypothetical protein